MPKSYYMRYFQEQVGAWNRLYKNDGIFKRYSFSLSVNQEHKMYTQLLVRSGQKVKLMQSNTSAMQ